MKTDFDTLGKLVSMDRIVKENNINVDICLEKLRRAVTIPQYDRTDMFKVKGLTVYMAMKSVYCDYIAMDRNGDIWYHTNNHPDFDGLITNDRGERKPEEDQYFIKIKNRHGLRCEISIMVQGDDADTIKSNCIRILELYYKRPISCLPHLNVNEFLNHPISDDIKIAKETKYDDMIKFVIEDSLSIDIKFRM